MPRLFADGVKFDR